ncbi:cysteine-rich CWC family protein [Ramlibacter sp. AW1]|uniref:Cysteine-rich CWC family protein n=1 Tax=Ramlibacter aurantiacus TaxID=2801330 RepID=A0A936ZH96_9BURK|nr:cysteine-rich CWC family protein [Ramlibacter aurantiacus]MBL0421404.1 cysteine-rich CWC family protein [Ramlibacter aurantiacus]
MPDLPLSVRPDTCPLCGGPNGCAVEVARARGEPPPASCWCTAQRFSPDLLARVPGQARRRACICPHCVQAPPEHPQAPQ